MAFIQFKLRGIYHAAAATLAIALGAAPALAEPGFPTKPIRLLVGYAPASGADVVARLVATRLQQSLKQTVVVDNKPGAGGLIAAQETARAAPDGYTLMMGAMPQISIAPASNARLPYDPIRDFAPVSQLVDTDLVLITNPQRVPSASMQEFVAWGKKQPSLFFGTPGPGTVGHFGAYFLADAAKVAIEPIHFKSTGDAILAMLNGEVHAQFVPYAVAAPQVKAGKLRAVLVTGPMRSAMFPDAPTSKEAGYPGVQFSSWYGVLAPANTPADVLDKLNAEIIKLSTDAEMRSRLEEAGLRVTGTSREDFARIIRDDGARWGRVVKATGFKSQD